MRWLGDGVIATEKKRNKPKTGSLGRQEHRARCLKCLRRALLSWVIEGGIGEWYTRGINNRRGNSARK